VALILVVEDEQPIRELLVLLLRAHGHRVETAENGALALARVAAERPDLVLADVMMPVMSGVELCQRLKGDPATAGIPVLLMSAVDARHAAGAGADAFVPKPFELDQIDTLVEHWLAAR
jgi:CheY-like chemotaxis protein